MVGNKRIELFEVTLFSALGLVGREGFEPPVFTNEGRDLQSRTVPPSLPPTRMLEERFELPAFQSNSFTDCRNSTIVTVQANIIFYKPLIGIEPISLVYETSPQPLRQSGKYSTEARVERALPSGRGTILSFLTNPFFANSLFTVRLFKLGDSVISYRRDSNPRGTFTSSGLQIRRNQPLCDYSIK